MFFLKKIYLKVFNSLGSRGYLKWVEDKTYLRTMYKARMGYDLNLNKPKKFTEKMQWLKLYDRNPYYIQLVDKFRVREYISQKIGEEYLVPLLGAWSDFDDIEIDKLPNKFVLKTNHDSGGVVICKDKNNFNIKEARMILNRSLNRNYYFRGREWPYKNVNKKIIAEKYLESEDKFLKDYKIMCFNGNPRIIQVMSDRNINGFKLNHFDVNWNEIILERKTIERNTSIPKEPKNLDKMLKISKKISKGLPFVRVDFYEVRDNLYFGEITLYPVSGFMDFKNMEDDYLLGTWINLKK